MIGLAADELIVDNFAGGGGASTGILMALGRSPDIAINHDPEAIAMHMANHPGTLHLCENVWKVDIAKAVAGRKVGLAWFSPDCKDFSKAKGGKPVSKNIRGLAWVALRWAGLVKPRIIFLENVEEFQDWGLVHEIAADTARGRRQRCPHCSGQMDGKRCPKYKGSTFKRWCTQLRNLGYKVEFRELRACDYGAPTIRKRLFVIARRDGLPIVWPETTHAAEGDLFSEPYRTAAECIDWSLPCPSIFLTREEGRKIGVNRPLAENTMKRIARGVKRYVLDAKEPFIVNLTHHGSDRNESVAEPMRTVTGARRGEKALVVPYLTEHANSSTQRNFPSDEPLRTQCAEVKGGHFALVSPLLAGVGGRMGQSAERSVDDPYHTITAKQDTVLVMAMLQNQFENNGAPPDEPLKTVLTGNHHGVIAAHISPYYGAKRDSDARGASPADPLATQPTENHHALVAAHITRFNQNGVGSSPDEPLDTAMAGAPRFGLVSAVLDRQFGNSEPSPVDEPAGTTTAGGGGKSALVTAFLAQHNAGPNNEKLSGRPADAPISTITHSGLQQNIVASSLVKLRGTCRDGQPVSKPMATVSAEGTHIAEVRAFLMAYYGTEQNPKLNGPLPSATTRDRFGLVTVQGEDYFIADIGMRMLTPRELFTAQGFPLSYIIDRGVDPETGEIIKLTKTAQIRMCGNSVSPCPAAAIVSAQFGGEPLEAAA